MTGPLPPASPDVTDDPRLLPVDAPRVDTAADADAPTEGEGTAAWRLWLGAGIVVALASGLVASLLPRDGDADAARPAIIPTEAAGDDLLLAADQALRAWAAFAGSGDVRHLRPAFALDGPQYRQLAQEAAALSARPGPRPAYRFALREAQVVVRNQRAAVVRAAVGVGRADQREHRYHWDLVLRRDPTAKHWRLWTVRTVGDGSQQNRGAEAERALLPDPARAASPAP